MTSVRWPVRMLVVACSLLPLLVVGGGRAEAHCHFDPTFGGPAFSVGIEGTLQVCVEVPFSNASLSVFVTPSGTTTAVGPNGLEVRVQGGVCAERVGYFSSAPSACVQDPTFTVFEGTWVESTSQVGASSNTMVGPCVSEEVNVLSGWRPVDVGTACVYQGDTVSATVRPDRTASVHVAPGLCVTYTYPTYGYSCYFVHSWTNIDGRGTVPVFHEVVAVCEHGYYYYPPCTVRHEQRVP